MQINVLIGRAELLYFLIKKFLNLYANDTGLFFFRWMYVVNNQTNDVVNNQANHQFTSIKIVHFMNNAVVCWIIRRTIFNVYVCLNHS